MMAYIQYFLALSLNFIILYIGNKNLVYEFVIYLYMYRLVQNSGIV